MSINCIQLKVWREKRIQRSTEMTGNWRDLWRKLEAFKVRGGGFNCLNICREKMQNKRKKKRSYWVQAEYRWHEIHVWQGLLFQNKRFPFEKKRACLLVWGGERLRNEEKIQKILCLATCPCFTVMTLRHLPLCFSSSLHCPALPQKPD